MSLIRKLRVFPVVAFLVAAAFLSAGCGSKTVKVKGSLLANGKPYTVTDKEEVMIIFFPVDLNSEEAVAAAADLNRADGTFVVRGPTNTGIPPGKYRIAVTSSWYGKDGDRFRNFYSPDNSPLVCEVTGKSGQEITIDLARKTVQ
jgi:hypothetical protein